jgi:DNA-binding MarR family transcriptional regulator
VKKESLIPSQIADILFCDRPTASAIIANLEEKGYLSRSLDSDNKRQLRIVITPKGRKKLEEIGRQPKPESPFKPLACFTAEEKKQLEALLIKLHTHFERLEEYKND